MTMKRDMVVMDIILQLRVWIIDSVTLGQSVQKILPSFNYYTRNTNQQPEGTSIEQVDDPIVATGTPVFVYEIPEWLPDSNVYQNSTNLLAAVFKSL